MVDGVLSVVSLVSLGGQSGCFVSNILHAAAQIPRQRVHSLEDARRRCLALRVRLCLDSIHVGGAGREALA